MSRSTSITRGSQCLSTETSLLLHHRNRDPIRCQADDDGERDDNERMRSRTLGAVRLMVAVIVGSSAVAIVSTHPADAHSPRSGSRTDPELRVEVDRALARRLTGRRDPLVSVEVLTADNIAVERAVNDLAGTVTGSVEGQLVQAFMPAGAVDQLSAIAAVRYVQHPLRINRLPREEAVGTGTLVGDEVQLTNANLWHQAGIIGNTRVGIIDFFDFTAWNPSENRPVPDAASNEGSRRTRTQRRRTGPRCTPRSRSG